jgi:two-component system, OmpR family, phosphate regulon sensor histidine kinase PhoR
MTSATIRRVIVLGAFAIMSLITVQTYWVLRTWDLQEREFHRKVTQALLETANDLKRLHGFKLPTQNLIDQLSSNYYVVNINNMFDPGTVEIYLQRNFEKQALSDDFQYGIFDCSSNQMVMGKMIKYSNEIIKKDLETPLPAHYNSDFIYYFGVRFPEKTANILSNMWIVVFFTGLMLVTVAFFIYSMFIILRQKQLSEMQRDFINNMTHEFKTPISTINISTDVFLNNPIIKEDVRLTRYASIIKEQVLRLNTQVEKVLQLAKIEQDNVELSKEDINLEELVKSTSPSIELKVAERKGKLNLNLETTNALIVADQLHLTNIIHNLVDNGVKYSKDTPEITIGLKNVANSVVLSIEDKGIGIPKESQKKVFERFYRVPTGNIHNVKGFGLGLFYVKSVCKEHNWKISIESELGKGTTVFIKIPTKKVD